MDVGAGAMTEDVKEAAKADARDEDDESLLKEWVGLLVRAACWALLIYLLIFQVSVVDGPSMYPTFHHGDRLVIDKLSYRFVSVGRFDVIVFEAIDRDKSPRMARDYIKRVIGLPGDTVEIHGGYAWVNGKKLDEPFGPTRAQTLPGFSDGQAFVVPPGYYFVMGDNRDGSKDSRVAVSGDTLGMVPGNEIKGVVRLRLWPWARRKWFSRGVEEQ
jgi:signal peptidase I